ncbi:hypothetical protein C343_05406 [Cryptococcus neoformans C23]|uniref:VPS4-associated protein 1 n=2 Tax=Cryptococcus neoformans TaxID=5207 RepID=J9VV15_CRYN9|nr:hypothetical protein CNAG_04544 [Cryptococcus neoformans var. grubii H99]AUB27258.1 hypothetical protein CKF44_04544 [Cryptococcus neoformans var. grubii]OWZ40918.1 hypothetical protein C343_05406 [Cryptococcus neoformans var. grubii C23]OXC82723.1 hypothetical protein C344_05129 [Cryptococcus neoformans var. grubii AD1-7a]OXG28631.1 hypothetical protein C360_05775 [Cryptococcus neoformans var. grubii Bt15]OXG36499.1 hypothetical protein C359_05274 [Cryptococcus neoformans var. grubii Bt120|eukprot:XP_012051577.1 hypothetical protein CNAG_04544 [Cryptococcus neoformans var. grubii H99]
MASPALQKPTITGPLQNIYYERKVATEKPCYICHRPTVTVLATLKMEDWLYTCDGHLSDPGFASLIPPTTASPTPVRPSSEDIRKVVAEYKAREAEKSKSAGGKDKGGEGGSKVQDKGKDKGKESPKSPASPAPASTPTPTPTPTHRKFALHRAIFDMRRNELKRREMGVKAREVGKGLPQVPRTGF